MTKSVINAMVGVLVRQQKLVIEGLAPVAAWSDPRDPRRAIAIDNFLRMTGVHDIGESLPADWISAFDPSSQMEFDMPDMAAFAVRDTGGPPGSIWKCTNGNIPAQTGSAPSLSPSPPYLAGPGDACRTLASGETIASWQILTPSLAASWIRHSGFAEQIAYKSIFSYRSGQEGPRAFCIA
jgi:hypothetical protein